MKIKIFVKNMPEILPYINTMISNGSLTAIMLFGGDRYSCCDTAIVAYHGSDIVGIATIAPKGESQDQDHADLVGIQVAKGFRRKGIGRELMSVALEHCEKRKILPLHITTFSTAGQKLAESIDSDDLVINVQPPVLDMLG